MRGVEFGRRNVLSRPTGRNGSTPPHLCDAYSRQCCNLIGGAVASALIIGASLLLLVLLPSLPILGPAAASALSADSDFAARCAAPGVLRCVDFDTAAWLARAHPLDQECWGCDFGVMSNNFLSNVPTIDTTVKASGAGSMKFTIPVGATSSSAGSWFTHFGPNKTGQITTGQRIFVQFRLRWSPELLVPSNWPGSGGAKVMDISLGDLPSCNQSAPDPVNCPTSCPNQGFEFVLQNNQQRGVPTVYANCSGTANFTWMAGGSGLNPEPQNMVHCAYPNFASPPCRPFRANEWMTFKIMLAIGQWNAWANPVKVWFGREGQPLELIIDCESSQSNKCTADFAQGANGWWFQNSDPATYKMGKVYLHPYQTGLSGSRTSATVWYDELIISTQDIADPGGGSPLPPSAPCCLTVSQLAPVSAVVLAVILFSRRWYRRSSRGSGRSALDRTVSRLRFSQVERESDSHESGGHQA